MWTCTFLPTTDMRETTARGATRESAKAHTGPFRSPRSLGRYIRCVNMFHSVGGYDWAAADYIASGVWCDGTHFVMEAWCDSSGFGCQQDITFTFGPRKDIEDQAAMGLEDMRAKLKSYRDAVMDDDLM